jgi:hypothetical protein
VRHLRLGAMRAAGNFAWVAASKVLEVQADLAESGNAMRQVSAVAVLLVGFAMSGFATPKPADSAKAQPFPGTLVNARFVYVAAYDGDQFNPNLLPEDRDAIATVQDTIQKWGKLILVYEPGQADIIILVQSRPSEDVLAVYDAHLWPSSTYLWRVMGRAGLQTGETPLVTQFEKGFESVQKHK